MTTLSSILDRREKTNNKQTVMIVTAPCETAHQYTAFATMKPTMTGESLWTWRSTSSRNEYTKPGEEICLSSPKLCKLSKRITVSSYRVETKKQVFILPMLGDFTMYLVLHWGHRTLLSACDFLFSSTNLFKQARWTWSPINKLMVSAFQGFCGAQCFYRKRCPLISYPFCRSLASTWL